MGDFGDTGPASVVVGAKGRVVLPVAVRRDARIEEGDELVIGAVGEGRLLLETRAAIRSRVWNAAPEPSGIDAVDDVRLLRQRDLDQEARSVAARDGTSIAAGDADLVGQALLARLGL